MLTLRQYFKNVTLSTCLQPSGVLPAEHALGGLQRSRSEVELPNGKFHDNPLSDFTIHGRHPFPKDIEDLLRRIHEIGRRQSRWPLGENWPYSPREFDWQKGKDLDEARRDLRHLLSMLESGRDDEILVDPRTNRPFKK